MNTFLRSNSKWMIPASMLVAPLALGIEGPEDQAVPPKLEAAHPPIEAAHPPIEAAPEAQVEAMPIQEVAYIGLVTGPIPELLCTHLGLRNGDGVLVRSVMPKGPAETAGIKESDIIVSVDGKIALSPAELGNIIRSHQPGDKVKVGLIQAGKGTELEVMLGTRPDQMAQLRGGNAGEAFRMQGMPEDMAERLRDMIEGNMMQFQFDGQNIQPLPGIPDIQRDMKEMRLEMKELRELQEGMLKEGPEVGFNAASTIRLMDDKGSVELKTEGGETRLTVRDKDNEIEWEGPWTTDEDKAKAPEEIRERAGNLKMDGGLNLNGGGFKFEFGR